MTSRTGHATGRAVSLEIGSDVYVYTGAGNHGYLAKVVAIYESGIVQLLPRSHSISGLSVAYDEISYGLVVKGVAPGSSNRTIHSYRRPGVG